MGLFLVLILSYLAGSFPTSIIVARLVKISIFENTAAATLVCRMWLESSAGSLGWW